MSGFPSSQDSFTGYTAGETLSAANNAAQLNQMQAAIVAIEAKLGIGASVAGNNQSLVGNGVDTLWGQIPLGTGTSGILPVNQGGSGSGSSTGSGSNVLSNSSSITSPTETNGTYNGATLNSPTINTPVISGYPNNSIPAAALVNNSLTTNQMANGAITPNILATGANTAIVLTSESSATQTYGDNLTTPGPSVTVTIGVNGLALIILTVQSTVNAAGTAALTTFVASGANTIAASDNAAIQFVPYTTGSPGDQRSWATILTGLSAGSTTFKMQYRVTGNTGTWANRRISVIPL